MSIGSFTERAISYGQKSHILNPKNIYESSNLDIFIGKPLRAVARLVYCAFAAIFASPVRVCL